MAMNDLISRAAAVRALASSNGDYLDALERFEKIPAVDVVPVVRCKDCEWFDCKNYVCNNDILAGRIADCGCYPNFNVEPDWFCADGERRDGGGKDD